MNKTEILFYIPVGETAGNQDYGESQNQKGVSGGREGGVRGGLSELVTLEWRPKVRWRSFHSRVVTGLADKFPPEQLGDSWGALRPQSLGDAERYLSH